MISKQNYDKLKEKFGSVASWAIWQKPSDTPKSNMGDMSVFNDPNLLEKLNPNVVFVGLNASGRHEEYLKTAMPWFNFHSGAPTSNSYKLRYALINTPLWGGYITDAIKFYKDSDSSNVGRFIKANHSVVEENIALLTEELSLLGTNPLLIALGGRSFDILNAYLTNKYRIRKITHYSAQFSYKEVYPNEIRKIIVDEGLQ